MAVGAAAVALPGPGVVQAAPITLEIPLVGSQEVPAVTSPGSGFARVTFDEATKVLTYAVTISGISTEEVTAAHIHRGATGVNGPIVYTLSPVGFTTIGGSINLTDADVADLKAGNFYINAHSKTNPGGFARGQINLSPEAAIQAVVNRTVDAWNRKDAAGFMAGFTTRGLLDEFDASTVDEIREALPEFIGDPPISRGVLSNLQVLSPSSARAFLDLELGRIVERHDYTFVLADGGWKIDGGPIVPAPIPSGVASVAIQTQEFGFVYDRSAVASGNFAFEARNVGKQAHEIALAKIPENAILRELLETEEDVPGFEFVGQVFMEPGETARMVFTRPLSAGRYAMVCFIPDEATGTPHAFLGMTSEFTVSGSGGTSGVRPPNTGDAGLAETPASGSHTLLFVLAALAIASGIGVAGVARYRASDD